MNRIDKKDVNQREIIAVKSKFDYEKVLRLSAITFTTEIYENTNNGTITTNSIAKVHW